MLSLTNPKQSKYQILIQLAIFEAFFKEKGLIVFQNQPLNDSESFQVKLHSALD